MATKIWTGATDTDWGTATNWSPVNEPVSNDKVIFPNGGTRDALIGLANNTVDLDLLITEPGYSGNIGASANYLTLTSDRVIHRGSGELWYKDNSSTTFTTDEVIVDTSGGAAFLTGDNLERVLITRGQLTFGGDVSAVGLLEIVQREGQTPRVTLTAGSSAVYDLVVVQSGNVLSDCAIRRLAMGTGAWIQDTQEIQHIEMFGGLVDYRTPYSSGTHEGLVLQAKIMGGVFDLTTSADEKKILDLFVHPHATIRKDDNLVTVVNDRTMGETQVVKR